MNDAIRFWEKGYSDHKVWAMGGPSVEVFEVEQVLPKNSTVLDIGCGDGRNSVFLALRGHKVTALELSSSAVNKLRSIANQFSLDITVVEGRIEDFEPNQRYDFVLAHSSLHFVEKKVWVPLVNKLRDLTHAGGYHNITSFIGTPQFPVPPECRHANSFARGDLDNVYNDWQIIRSDFYAKWDSHPGIPMHVHVVEKFVARKAARAAKFPFKKMIPAKRTTLSKTLFSSLPLNIDRSTVRASGVLKGVVHCTNIPSISPEKSGMERGNYTIEDWVFKDRGLQFTQGRLTGKYEYFTQPFYLMS